MLSAASREDGAQIMSVSWQVIAVIVLFALCSDMTGVWKRKQVSPTQRCSLRPLPLNRLVKITFLAWHAVCPAMEAGHVVHLGRDRATGLGKQQMEGVSKATEGFPVTVKSCHLCSHLNLSSKSKGIGTCSYTFYDKRNLKNKNLNLIKWKPHMQMSKVLSCSLIK